MKAARVSECALRVKCLHYEADEETRCLHKDICELYEAEEKPRMTQRQLEDEVIEQKGFANGMKRNATLTEVVVAIMAVAVPCLTVGISVVNRLSNLEYSSKQTGDYNSFVSDTKVHLAQLDTQTRDIADLKVTCAAIVTSQTDMKMQLQRLSDRIITSASTNTVR